MASIYSWQSRNLEDATKVLVIYIHYNRKSVFNICLGKTALALGNNDAVWVLDNGSNFKDNPEKLVSSVSIKFPSLVFRFTSLPVNHGGNAAAEYVYLQLFNGLFPNVSHYVLLGDDDFIRPDLSNFLPCDLDNTRIYAWNYDYYDYRTGCRINSSSAYTYSLQEFDALECLRSAIYENNSKLNYLRHFLYKILLLSRFISIQRNNYSYPSIPKHNSATLLPIRALIKSMQKYGSIVTYPYGDVGNIMLLEFVANVFFIDIPGSTIGRGFNYGVTSDIAKMALNHPGRFYYRGMPSLAKYIALSKIDLVKRLKLEHSHSSIMSHYIGPHFTFLFASNANALIKYAYHMKASRKINVFCINLFYDILLLLLLCLPLGRRFSDYVCRSFFFDVYGNSS